MNDSGLEFDLENTLEYWRYIKCSSKMILHIESYKLHENKLKHFLYFIEHIL